MLKNTLVAVTALAPILIAALIPAAASPDRGLSYAEDVEALVVKRCAGCHNSEDPKAQLLLERGVGFDQLVGRASIQAPGTQLVMPSSPSESYLWHKLDFTAEVGKGMPRTLFGARRLPDEELEIIRRWIEDGALP